jgi:hypothetical protein
VRLSKYRFVQWLMTVVILSIVLPNFSFTNLETQNYKPSQLAKLMERMHLDMKNYREKVVAQKNIPDLSKKWKKIYTAQPTDESVKGEKFDAYADHFFEKYNELLSAQDNQRKTAYNNLVTNCVSCHESFCPGPIKLIKKLYIN